MTIGKWHKILDSDFIEEIVMNNAFIGQTYIEQKIEDSEVYGRIINLFTGCDCNFEDTHE